MTTRCSEQEQSLTATFRLLCLEITSRNKEAINSKRILKEGTKVYRSGVGGGGDGGCDELKEQKYIPGQSFHVLSCHFY